MYRYRIDRARGIVWFAPLTHQASPVSFASSLDALLNEPSFEAGMHFVVDRRGNPPPSSEHMRGVVENVASRASAIGSGRWAVIVDAESTVAYGFGRVGEAFAEYYGIESRVFDQEEDALTWVTTA